ncbi:MAG: response regulator, partial [Cetobacterium somerae]|uniref:response regulator n=1 Tax=Cetobacterium somerae TaxID=188913 RepID=UPI003F30CD5B
MNILIIDDEKSQEDVFKNANEYMYENKFKLSFAKNIEEACKIILMKKFEVIIVDLDLSKQTKDFLGNELIKIVLEKIKCFLIVYSGNIEKLDEGLIQNFKNSPFFMKIDKGVKIPEHVLGIIEEREYLFPIIKDDTIENSINEIFWNGYNEIYQVEIEKKYRDDKEKEKEILKKIEVCQTEFDEERKRLEEIETKITEDYVKKGMEKNTIATFKEGKELLKKSGASRKKVDILDRTLKNLKDEIGKVKQKREKRERGLSDYKAILLEHSIIESYNQKEEKIEGSLMYISKGLCKSI